MKATFRSAVVLAVTLVWVVAGLTRSAATALISPEERPAVGVGTTPSMDDLSEARPGLRCPVEGLVAAKCPNPAGCSFTGCVGKDPDVQNCTGATIEEKWIAGIQATLRIRSASNCGSRWGRLHWLSTGGSCAMSGVAIQHRRLVSGAWQIGAAQEATKGVNGWCASGAYWTPMVAGSTAEYRYRTANGYMEPGCSSDCVRFTWSAWSAWK